MQLARKSCFSFSRERREESDIESNEKAINNIKISHWTFQSPLYESPYSASTTTWDLWDAAAKKCLNSLTSDESSNNFYGIFSPPLTFLCVWRLRATGSEKKGVRTEWRHRSRETDDVVEERFKFMWKISSWLNLSLKQFLRFSCFLLLKYHKCKHVKIHWGIQLNRFLSFGRISKILLSSQVSPSCSTFNFRLNASHPFFRVCVFFLMNRRGGVKIDRVMKWMDDELCRFQICSHRAIIIITIVAATHHLDEFSQIEFFYWINRLIIAFV